MNLFSQSVVYLLIFFTESFAEYKFLILIRSNLSLLSSMNHAFDVVYKMSLPRPRSSRFSPVLPSRSFIFLHFTFNPF